MNAAGVLNGNLISGGQSFQHKDNTARKDLDFAVGDGLRSRKGNVEKNLANSAGNMTNSVCDTSGSDPEQNDYSFSIDSVNPKKLCPSETNDTSQMLESDGFSVSPNDVGSNYFQRTCCY